MDKLANKINAYRRNECRRSNNKKTPGRCEAATIYANKANKFIRDSIKNSIIDTNNNQTDLYNSRSRKTERDIYPILNHDFDYKTAMIKKNNVFNLGFTNQPTVSNLLTHPFKIKKFLNILVNDAYPDKRTIAGIDDVIQQDVKKTSLKNKYRVYDDKLPYPSFKKDYPECRYKTKGEHSSSYFIKSGVCKTKINNEEECKRNKFKWIKNKATFPKIFKKMVKTSKTAKPVEKLTSTCYKPRYIYIDNSAKGIFGKKGLQPSMLNDIMSITPDKLSHILSGNSVEGGGILPCPEQFLNYGDKSSDKINPNIVIFLVLLFSLIIMLKITKKI
jgi:hypothetical protein